MKKKTKRISEWSIKKKTIAIAAVSLLSILLLAGAFFGTMKMRYYDGAADQAGAASIRELILTSVRGLKKDAPVDPRTGDIYFPESRLFLPNPGIPLTLTYQMDTGDITNSQSELSVSTYPVRGTEALYTARNTEELFAAVPKLQACSRGIKIVHQEYSKSDVQHELKQTVRLNNGSTVYVYLEKDCSEMTELANKFKSIQAY